MFEAKYHIFGIDNRKYFIEIIVKNDKTKIEAIISAYVK
jgi:hypothetical protein